MWTLRPRSPHGLQSHNYTRDESKEVSDAAVVDQVLAYWAQHSVPWLPGVAPTELDAFEASFNVELPPDLRLFYTVTNGTEVPSTRGQDHQAYDFVPLQMVAPDPEINWAWTLVDYRESSWWYSIDLLGMSRYGINAMYLLGAVHDRPLLVARSFSEFLQLYVEENIRLRIDGAEIYDAQMRRTRP